VAIVERPAIQWRSRSGRSMKIEHLLPDICPRAHPPVLGNGWKKVVKLNYFQLTFLVNLSVKLFLKLAQQN